VVLSGNNSWSYVLDNDTINAASKAILTIRFHPSASGLASSQLKLVTNDNYSGDYFLRLFGNGIAQNLNYEVSRKSVILQNEAIVDLGNLSVGQQIESVIQLKNTGNIPLKINSIFLTGDTDFFSVVGKSQIIKQKNSISIPVILNIKFVDSLSREAILNISTNHPTQPNFQVKFIAKQKITSVSTMEYIESKLFIYPNPAKNQITISTAASLKNASVSIFDMTGRLVHEKNNLEGKSNVIDISNYDSGIYFFEINQSNEFIRAKVIKE
ncbi:MAG: T9SS type A sorting domain-containing protein, partial [Bacteroidota bacterium]